MDEKNEVNLERARLHDIIENAISLCRGKSSPKQIKIVQKYNEDITARIDIYLLEQAFINLLDNAVKYSGDKSEIHITIDDSPDEIAVQFKDFGSGISEKHLSRIFERFYRIGKARSRNLGGTGLGLAIVKHIAIAHGGSVSVQSVPGQGSTFVIHLPKSH